MPIAAFGAPFITKEEREQLQDLCDGCTPGPWRVTEFDESRSSVRGIPNDDSYDITPVCQILSECIWGTQDDLFLMAVAREAIPKLLAEISRLEARLEHK